jgi:hypothetical protein
MMIQVIKNERSFDGGWQPIETIQVGCSWGEAWYRVLVVNRLSPKNRVYGLACCWQPMDKTQRQLQSSFRLLPG